MKSVRGLGRSPMLKLQTALFVLALVLGSDVAVAADDAAEVQLVRRALTDIDAAARAAAPAEAAAPANVERARALVERYVDLAGFEARVLSDVAPSLTPEQQKTLSEALRPLLVHRIALRLRGLPPQKPVIDPPREESGDTHVRLRFKNEAEGDLDVDLVFAKRAQPTAPLRVVDATIAGASLTKNLRASVNKVMRRDGFDGLVARLRQLRDAKVPGPHKSSDLTL